MLQISVQQECWHELCCLGRADFGQELSRTLIATQATKDQYCLIRRRITTTCYRKNTAARFKKTQLIDEHYYPKTNIFDYRTSISADAHAHPPSCPHPAPGPLSGNDETPGTLLLGTWPSAANLPLHMALLRLAEPYALNLRLIVVPRINTQTLYT